MNSTGVDILPTSSQIYAMFAAFGVDDLKKLILGIKTAEMEQFIEKTLKMPRCDVCSNWSLSNEILVK